MLIRTKPFVLAAMLSATLALTACQTSTPNQVLAFSVPASNGQFNLANQSQALVNVVVQDARPQPEVSSYVAQEKIVKLTASPTVSQLFQQIFLQDLNAKGFHISQASQANINVIIRINDFYANVEQGNLRHKISSKIRLEIQVQGRSGTFSKNMSASRSQEGAFSAKNDEIQQLLTETLTELSNNIYQDQEISQAINQYSR